MENKSNLAKAVIEVMKAVKNIEKNVQVGDARSGYAGVSDKDVKEKIGKAMADNGLCIMPIDVEESTQIDRWEETTNYNNQPQIKVKQSVFTKVSTKYLLLHDSGESQVITGYGHGVDSQDKGAGKATTYALKNALLLTFMVPTGTIEDTDTTHSNDLPVPQKKLANNTNFDNQNSLSILDAVQAVEAAKSRKEVYDTFNKYPQYKDHEQLKAAVYKMYAKYPKAEKAQ